MHTPLLTNAMADVDMTDVGTSAPAKSKISGIKSSKAGGADTASDGKKRFEVKKVYPCRENQDKALF